MSRDEFIVFDTFKTVSMIKFVMSLMVMIIGKFGLPGWCSSAWMTKKKMKGCGCFTFILILMGLFAASQMKNSKDIMIKYNKP